MQQYYYGRFYENDEETPLPWDPEVLLDFDVVRGQGGEPELDVSAVYSGGQDLLKSNDDLLRMMGARIITQAEKDPLFWEQAIQDAGWSFSGMNGNDPAGRWSAPSAAE